MGTLKPIHMSFAFLLLGLAVLAPLREAAAADTLARVPPNRVCMVNDTAHATDQIPVAVEGKTYFGCCEMCKERLARDTQIRHAVDPVSGRPVDKSIAVIGASANGKVLYFESEKTFASYAGGQR